MTGPGNLNRRLTLEVPTEAADGAGGVTRGYAVAATLWAELVPLSARGAVTADSLGNTQRYRIVIRAYGGITTRHRFRDGERVFRILAVQASADRRYLGIEVEERTG